MPLVKRDALAPPPTTSAALATSRAAASRSFTNPYPPMANTIVKEQVRHLSAESARTLELLRARRETVEKALTSSEWKIYDLESEYLRQCIELGGSLFDGYGLERKSMLHSGVSVAPTRNQGGTSSPLSAEISADSGSSASSPVAAYPVNENTGMAFQARLVAFSPSERLFSSSAVGALGHVELAITLKRQPPSGRSHLNPKKSSLDDTGKRVSGRRRLSSA